MRRGGAAPAARWTAASAPLAPAPTMATSVGRCMAGLIPSLPVRAQPGDTGVVTPLPGNEPVQSHAPGSPERAALKAALSRIAGQRADIPLRIGGRDVRTGRTSE